MKKMLFLWFCFPTLLFGQSFLTGMQEPHNQYENGLPHGNWFSYYKVVDRDTILVKKTVYDRGLKLSDTTYNIKTGKFIQTITYKGGLEDGVSKEFWPNGRLRGEVPYKHGVVDGIVKSYSSGGKLLTQLLYVDGQENLRFSDRYLSDQIVSDTSYLGCK